MTDDAVPSQVTVPAGTIVFIPTADAVVTKAADLQPQTEE